MDNPTILLPGITGSSLENYYDLRPDTSWSGVDALRGILFGPSLGELALDPTGEFDRELRVITRPDGLLPVAYAPLVNALRQRRKAPVYVFPFDWRYSVVDAASKLAEFVGIVRKKNVGATKIDFVCHSMGGLVFRSFLGATREKDIGKVVFLAVPHQGSLEPMDAMIRGRGLFGARKEMRKLARTFPGLYELLPAFDQALVDKATGDILDVFDAESWQGNVLPTGSAGVEQNGFDVTQERLTAAKAVVDRLRGENLRDLLEPAQMLTIYGAKDGSTLESVTVGPGPDRKHDFEGALRGPGDGVVLSESARLDGVQSIRLTGDDVAYLGELSVHVLGMHAAMGSMDETQTIISRFLAGDKGTDR